MSVREMHMENKKMENRNRVKTNLTLDRDFKNKLEKAAAAYEMPVSRYLEVVIRRHWETLRIRLAVLESSWANQEKKENGNRV